MEVNELLADRIIPNPIEKFTAEMLEFQTDGTAKKLFGQLKKITGELLGLQEKTLASPLLNRRTAELGLLILNRMPDSKKSENHWTLIEPAVSEDERCRCIGEMVPEEGWNTQELKNLLIYFFGEEKAEYVGYAWDRIRFQMYQTGYARRSFRSPNNRKFYLVNQINFLIAAIPQVNSYGHYPDYKRQFYDLSVAEQIKYSHLFNQSTLFRLWSAAIDLGNREVYQQAEDIIFNKDTVGKVTRDIIKALLNSEKEEAWLLVEKLLLAAQRQEGLRQTILEALDETSVGALRYIINVIIKHKLTRFSSVVRAVDVWAGLGWESEREKTVVNFLDKAHEYLENPGEIPAAVKSANNTDVYMALWAQGVFDIEKTAPFLDELYKTGDAEKRSLALKFAVEAKHYRVDMPLFYRALDDADALVLAWALHGINSLSLEKYRRDPAFPELFDKLHLVVERTDAKEKTFDGKIFAWTRIVFNRKKALAAMIDLIDENAGRLDVVLSYFDSMNVNLREKLTRHILPDYALYSRDEKKTKQPLTEFQHNFAVRILADKGEYIVQTAFNALEKAEFSADEMAHLRSLLKRKGANFRGKIIGLLLKQSDGKVADAAAQLLTTGDGEQRLAGLDILLQLKKSDRLKTESTALVEEYKKRKTISPKEEILLSQLTDSGNLQNYSVEKGYGLFNAAKSISPIVPPRVDRANIYEKRAAKNAYGFSAPTKKIKKSLETLAEIYLQNKDYEYEAEGYGNTRQTVLLGNVFRSKKYDYKYATPQEEYAEYPLSEVWEQWFQNSGLDAGDLHLIQLSREPNCRNFIPAYNEVIPDEFAKQNYYNHPLLGIVAALELVHPFAEKNEFMLGGCVKLFSSLDAEFLQAQQKERVYYSTHQGNGWQGLANYHTFYNRINSAEIDDEFVEEMWNLANWRQFSGRPENAPFSFPSLMNFCRAFELKIIGEDEMLRGLMTADNIRILSGKTVRKNDLDYFTRFPFLEPMFQKVREHLLDIELKRGDSATSVTPLAASLQIIYGVKRFTEILVGLGKTTLHRGYSYYHNGEVNKQVLFSQLLKNSFPLETDTQEMFNESIKKAKVSETKLVEAAVYAPQWQKFVSRFLNWKGLDSAIWWMHAHTKISGYQEVNAEAESEVARYSAVDLQDFKDGAVDKDWFVSALKEIGKNRWTTVYDAAKYISDGNGHRRARLYADVISGATKIKEIAGKVKDKRDQDYLRMFGLAPLNRAHPERDVLSRYAYLQKFKKESRQFGAQKQTSEALAIRIALENLARNAGYADPLRLTWAMETEQVREIFSKTTEVIFGDVTVKLTIDETGKTDVVAFKKDVQLKNIPAKLKKEASILELNEHKKTLKDQFSRSRQGLEEAMTRGDAFQLSELENLFGHPVISKHLEKLVFTSEQAHGFYKDGTLHSAKGDEYKLAENAEIRLAHTFDLYESGEWSDYQRWCFERELKQPFKQIFRELYTPTADELKEKSISRRYAGHQIQPKKTAALLKTRGWKADYEEGLQKVFHKEGFTAKMYALADWFSPADVESPTLETVEFTSLKDYKNIAFETINPRIFSEVMRDIDLVVSVAHAGGVDPEASHSSIEMRAVLLKETARLYKLENVSVNGNHARIKGSLGEYSVHLGSAIVHKLPGVYLSILPVQSQHRGRIFLPFADDDPKSAELLSKVLLLARDGEIQDPTILRQLNN